MIKLAWSSDVNDYGYYRAEISFSGTSDSIVLASGMEQISVALHPTSSARIEYTLSSLDKVSLGTAKWIVWPLGDITSGKADSLLSAVTAIRGVSTGNSVIELCAI